MKPEDLFGIKTWGELVFDQTRPVLYFTEAWLDKQENRMRTRLMHMTMMDGEPRALTQGTDDTRPLPSPDGSELAFLSKRSGTRQVWLLPLHGGEARQFTFITGGVKDMAWVPDGSGLVVVAHLTHGLLLSERTAAETVDASWSDAMLAHHFNQDVRHIDHQYYKLDGHGFFDGGRDQLVWVSRTGQTELLTSGFHNVSEPVFAPDGSALFCLSDGYDRPRSHPQVRQLCCFVWATNARRILELEQDLGISGLSVSPDGRSLAFHGVRPNDAGYGLTTLYRYEVGDGRLTDLSSCTNRSVGDESGADVPAPSTAKPTFCGDGIWTLLSDQGRVLVAAFGTGGCRRIGEDKRVVYDFACRGDWLAMAVSDPVHPSGIVLQHIKSADEQTRWAPVSWDPTEPPVAPEEMWAQEGDGTRVHTWCIRPAIGQRHPVVLQIHGGPMSMYGYRYHHEFQCLVSAGYAVVYTNPRGSQGYGETFCQAIMGQWGDKDYRDVLAGLDQALDHWSDLDGDRLGVAGGSYGGFMVNWLIAHQQRFKAAVTMRSVVNRFSAMGSSDMGWIRVPQYSHGPWWEEPATYWQQSPLKYASAIRTPLLIEHQEQDYRLPIEQGEQLYSALKYLGRTVELVIYPGESHGMSRSGQPWHRVHRLNTIVGWFDRWLRSSE